MRNILIVSSILIFLVSALNADILDIPEVKVYGERKIEVEPIKKQLLPFEKEYLQPSLINTKRGLPYFEVKDKKLIERNIGYRARADAGTYLGGYFLGYSRRIFYPLEVGLNVTRNSTTEDSTIQIFSRTSVENFYVNGAFYGANTSKPVYRVNIGNIHDLVDFDFQGIYSDSLAGAADINLNYNPFVFNLQLNTYIDYSIKVLYEKFPFQGGAVFYNKKIYPELVYFFAIYDLYIKGSLLNKTGLANFYCQSYQYLREYSSSDAYYRIELGQSKSVSPISLIYSHYLSNSSHFAGIKLSNSELFIEFEHNLKSSYMLRAGLSTRFTELISADIYGYTNSTENYFIVADLGYDLRNNLKVGIKTELNYLYGIWNEDSFDIGGYVFFAF